ncbi:MAG: hypothetical protein HYV92_01415, partial [Candidatus Rokubacteria bacterium]|nr:hypothetical protein [Candidatus Rokubacteria bacterium]
DVIEMNPYPLPEIDATVKSNRRIGLGIMGWADLLFIMGIPYDSQEALDLAEQIMAFVKEQGHDQSAKLAEERGPFPNWSRSIYKHGRPMRNSTVTTIAPTGTISMIAGCSSGIEPIFALAFEHRVKQPDGERVLPFVNEVFERLAREQSFYSEALMQEVLKRGSLHGIPGMPERAQQVFKTSHEIPYEWHVRHQAAFQMYTDNGVSKCVTGDTLIFTDRGILRIQDLYRGESSGAFSPIELKVADWTGLEPADLFYFGGKRDVVALEADLGFSLRATPNHRLRVMANGEIVWRRMDEIRVGDSLVVPYGFDVYGHLHDLGAIYGAQYRPAERTNAVRLQWPKKITTDLARLIGYLIADGGFNENQVIFTQKDDAVTEDYRQVMQRRFGVEPRVGLDPRRENLKQVVVNSRDLIAFFADYLGTGDRAETKRTPRCILASGPEVMKEYVRGLTLDGYVSERGRVVVLGTVSRQLAEEVQALLLNLGIVARLETKGIHYEYRHVENRKDACYEVVVLSKFRRAFLERIGFAEDRKQTRARKHLGQQSHPDTHYVVPGVRPLAVTLARAKMAEASSRKLQDWLHSFMTADAEITEETIIWLLDITRELKETSEWKTLSSVANRKVMYTPVTRLWSDKDEVFDLQVPSTHSFITNGLISHNTINLPNAASEEDVASAYLLAWKLNCLGITVFRDGCKGDQVLNVGIGAKTKKEEVAAPTTGPAVIKPRPHSLHGLTYRMETPIGTAFITVNETTDGEPFEVFVQVGKGGSDTMAVAEALGRLISLGLRLPSPFSAGRRLEEVINQLSRIGGGQPTGFGPSKVLSLPDALARTLAEYLGHVKPDAAEEGNGSRPHRIGDLCKECGQATFIYEEGCKKCLSCGYNEC